MHTVRTPAVAGLFYPADTAELHAQVRHFLTEVEAPAGSPPKAIIAPHAGYIYSGPPAISIPDPSPPRPTRGCKRPEA